ncbi:nuclear transport factor 2 family protein [Hymenobacter terrenus]|uniref:nuclear transport factor 2 family protein n=1 Tax=Hymenobacter terrenus TaxID=1629124 RepID=UPI000619D355|nr:nuclear transport factor 2 family protein [Hymenobacter terrenus]
MPTPEANTLLVRQFYEHLAASDLPAALALLAPGFRLVQAPSLPYGGEWVGATGLADFFRAFFSYWAAFSSEDVAYFAADDTVVATSTGVGTTHAGQVRRLPMVQVYRLREGQLASAQPFYFDTAALMGS